MAAHISSKAVQEGRASDGTGLEVAHAGRMALQEAQCVNAFHPLPGGLQGVRYEEGKLARQHHHPA